MKEKTLKWWEKKRAKGRSEYVLRDGGLFSLVLFGIITPIVKAVYRFVAGGFTLDLLDRTFQLELFVGLIISFPLGCLLGWLIWEFNEWDYRRTIRKTQ